MRVNGAPAKAATVVRVGDHIEARLHHRDRLLEVVRLIDKRVSASLAAECVIDTSPPPPAPSEPAAGFDRDRGAGRPTKRDRRTLDRLRGR